MGFPSLKDQLESDPAPPMLVSLQEMILDMDGEDSPWETDSSIDGNLEAGLGDHQGHGDEYGTP